MVKNYIYYRGGMFGHLIFSIVNNGVHLPDWIQTKFKSPEPLENDFQHFMTSLDLTTLTGCHSDPLLWGLENYQVICSDPDVCIWTVKRFFGMYPKLNRHDLLKYYYDPAMHAEIDRRGDIELQHMLAKKYQSIQHSVLVTGDHCLDVSCIFDQQALIRMLAEHFDFDHALAARQYHYWWQREQVFLQQFGQTI